MIKQKRETQFQDVFVALLTRILHLKRMLKENLLVGELSSRRKKVFVRCKRGQIHNCLYSEIKRDSNKTDNIVNSR